ncbi:MAG: hypothetical protein KDK25_12140 [Leptospiraceae bacterium]|nr:hypothetical protein [Leptospiraceae bacterium]
MTTENPANARYSLKLKFFLPMVLFLSLSYAAAESPDKSELDIQNFGALVRDGQFQWILQGKSPRPIASIKLKTPYFEEEIQPEMEKESFSKILEDRDYREFLWVFEAGPTRFKINLDMRYEDGTKESREIPVSFGEKPKELMARMAPLYMNPAPEKPERLPFLARNGKAWTIRACGDMDEVTFACEYIPRGSSMQNPDELYRYMLSRTRQGVDLTEIGPRIAQNLNDGSCKDFKFEMLKETPSEIIYEYSHAGCQGIPPTHELARMVNSSYGIKSFGFVAFKKAMDPELRQRMLKILNKEKYETSGGGEDEDGPIR